jgi:hypothetical protein
VLYLIIQATLIHEELREDELLLSGIKYTILRLMKLAKDNNGNLPERATWCVTPINQVPIETKHNVDFDTYKVDDLVQK